MSHKIRFGNTGSPFPPRNQVTNLNFLIPISTQPDDAKL